ncbi:MAG TPA: ABC transporter substrate binding protein [Blastocatellia bacterium]|nr:ABC transporter substrate binding protein [Blastocatellia bacterium]
MKSRKDLLKRFGLSLARGSAWLVCVILALAPLVAGAAEPTAPKGVLVLYWYGKDDPANIIVDQRIQAVLRSAPPGSIEYYAEYLETDRFPGERQALLMRNYLSEKYANQKVDVIIALSSTSLGFLLKYRNDLFPNTPIIFHTSSRTPPGEKADMTGLTGVIVDKIYRNTLDLALKLHPATEEAIVITKPQENNKKLVTEIKQELAEFESRGVKLNYVTDLTLEELIALVKNAPAKSVILYVRYAQDTAGKSLNPYEALSILTQSAKVPVYTAAGSLLGRGSVGGYSASLEDCATKAAEVALRIVNGVRAEDIPMVDVPTVPTFDWRQLQRLGISESRLPLGSVVLFKEPTFWERYRWWITGGVSFSALEAFLIVGLLFQRARRKRVEKALRESGERARRTLVEQMLAGIVECDAPGKFKMANQRFCDITGYAETELLEMGMTDIVHPDDLPRIVDLKRRLIETGESFVTEQRFRRKDGSEVWINSHVSPVRGADGKVERAVAIVIDITDRKSAEREREQFLKQEKAARAEAQAANQSKDEFLAMVSHELRSPLNSILGYARLLRAGGADMSQTKQTVEIIERNGRIQLQLIEDLLDTARIISGKLKLEVQPVALVSVITAALDVVRPAAQAKDIDLISDLDPFAGQVTGDLNRLQQVIWNLLSNAIKFTPRSGRVEVRMERVAGFDDHVRVTISDTGKGIEPEFLPFVFDRFRQSDSSSARRFGGLGLGLSLVKQLVELHGGTVEASSEGPGRGSAFTVTLPQHAAPTETFIPKQPRAVAAREVRTEAAIPLDQVPSLNGVRVLVVDDQEEARALLRATLGECGAQVTAVSSGIEAVAILADPPRNERPDVLILDINMPGEDGYRVLERVRALESERGVSRIPAVALTALGRSEDRLKAFAAGFRMHVAKPVEPAELAVVIASLVERLSVGRSV